MMSLQDAFGYEEAVQDRRDNALRRAHNAGATLK